MIPIHLYFTLQGSILGEYFGLAMAVCAVDLLRNACLGSETFNTRFSKEATLNRVGQDAVASFELLMQNSTVCETEATPESKVGEVFDTAEQNGLLQKIKCLQGELLELKRLRSEDGKANERVVSIFASKEQDWKVERMEFRNEQQKLRHELQRAFLQQEARCLKVEQLRGLQKQPCSECEHREAIFVELKERLGEQEFLIMATMEEAQIEKQEKNVLAEKLASVECSLSQLQDKVSMEAENHALELIKHKEALEQLETRVKEAEIENSRALQELTVAQASLAALIHEKNHCEGLIADMSIEITQQQRSVQGKDDLISAMLKKANADTEVRKELERELAFMNAKLGHAEREREKWRRLFEVNVRPSSKTEIFKPRGSFGSRTAPNTTVMMEEMQKLHDFEIQSLQSVFDEQVQMLQKRLSLYQDRISDLEEDMLLRMTDTKRMIEYKEHESLKLEIVDNKCMVVLKESMEAELAAKQFQLSVAKTLIKHYMESEVHREKELKKWKKLYLASKAIGEIHVEREHAGAIVPKNPKLKDWLELEKSCCTYKLDQRHWQNIDAFERQMKARDERMEAFRWQLLHMEDEAQRSRREIEALKQSLATAYDDKKRLEELLKRKEEEVAACQDSALVKYTKCACDEAQKGEVSSLQEKVSNLQTMLKEKEIEFELSLTKASAEAESELQDRECKLAVAEAQLDQAHISCDTERKEKEKLLLELQKAKSVLEHFFSTHLHSGAKKELQEVSYKACLALQRLSTIICEAQAQPLPRDEMEKEHIKELVDHCSPVAAFMEESGYIS
eukprot:c22823_g1_i1 orf=1102-3486(+)